MNEKDSLVKEPIEIIPMNKVGLDERGGTFDFTIRESKNFIYLTRKKGSLSGNTYHEGKSDTTAPKIFLLLTGEIELKYRNINNKAHNTIKITEPSIIKVNAFTTHSMEALSDFSILECNSILDIQNDRIKEDVVLQE